MKKIGDLLVALSAIAVIFSIIGAFGNDIWLASTQWILIAAVLGIYALYFKK
ncbi:MAG: hypothetical protein UT28_C0001G1000 [Berkelbacteria bacterium GW2011_GWE1_39_12]|uniref:Uncharacterized protein n=1 Tax=Berkelbacteria bacterium GW2011_GWE1_39_12 TaxID=1618337 RepID=A0A0G4B4N5_9BACT|nr:MAG: hypothetical protein UT28_C0001G1000 [Berkelbacteria bacterium GW2011_GWE1_39_12]